jgi:hypothetical protein
VTAPVRRAAGRDEFHQPLAWHASNHCRSSGHSEADDLTTFTDGEEPVRNGVPPESSLVGVLIDRRVSDPEPLKAKLEACKRSVNRG